MSAAARPTVPRPTAACRPQVEVQSTGVGARWRMVCTCGTRTPLLLTQADAMAALEQHEWEAGA